jgi:hypothetical protein
MKEKQKSQNPERGKNKKRRSQNLVQKVTRTSRYNHNLFVLATITVTTKYNHLFIGRSQWKYENL